MAAGDILYRRGIPIVFTDAGGDAVLSLNGLATGVARVSDRYDRGDGAQPEDYEARIVLDLAAGGVLVNSLEAYIGSSDATYTDGDAGDADAILTDAKLQNLIRIGSVSVEQSGAHLLVATKRVSIVARYIQAAVHNQSSANLQSGGVSRIILTPIIPQGQTA